jgi:hypothetical protein
VFAYVAGTENFDQLDLSLVPRIDTDLDVLHGVAQEAMDFRLMLIAEAIEAHYRKLRLVDRDVARKALSAALDVLTSIAESPRLDAGQRAYVRHHRGKTLLKLDEPIAARAEFESVVATGPGPAFYGSHLQLIRLCRDTPEVARAHFEAIFDAELGVSGSVSVNVLLAATEALSRRHMQQFIPELTAKYRSTLERTIKSAAACGYEHPYKALSAVA